MTYAYQDSATEMGDLLYDRPAAPGLIPLPMRRPKEIDTPCWVCPKIPQHCKACNDGTREWVEWARPQAVEMTEQNWRVYNHYLTCRAVGRFPNDPIVRLHAKVIRGVEDRYYHGHLIREIGMVYGVLLARAKVGL